MCETSRVPTVGTLLLGGKPSRCTYPTGKFLVIEVLIKSN